MKTSVPQFSWRLFYYYPTTTTFEHYFVQKKMPARVTRVPTRRWVNPTTTKTIVHRFFFALAHTLQKKVADEDDSTSWLKKEKKKTQEKKVKILSLSLLKKNYLHHTPIVN